MHKIRAGALQFVLFIGTIIALLLMAFVLLSYSHQFFARNTDKVIELTKTADNLMQQAISQSGSDLAIIISNMEDTNFQTEMRRDFWGVFEKVDVWAKHQQKSFHKMALIGQGIREELPALYLKDAQRPLVIAGNAHIVGDAYLPERGIRPGNIGGNSYYRSRLVHGDIHRSNAELPRLHPQLQTIVDQITDPLYQFPEETISYRQGMEIRNSFANPTIIISGFQIDLEEAVLKGNIVIRAEDKIVVSSGTQLRDVLLVAPQIEFLPGFSGNIQAFANEKIIVGRNCELSYPSALVIQNTRFHKDPVNLREPDILISRDSELRGLILYLDKSTEKKYGPQIKIDENSTLVGEIYCTHNLELKGQVFGKASVGSFISLENGGVYQNHLYNGRINSTKLPVQYAGLQMESNMHKSIAQWLY